MTIEIVRFGAGRRRPHGPPGTTGVTGLPIHSDERGVIAELALARGARIEPHSNPNLTWFLVVEGGGWVQVGEATARVAAGDAVLWPPDVVHGAWTEHGELRAFVVEYAIAGPAHVPAVIEGHGTALAEPTPGDARVGDGELHRDAGPHRGYDPAEGEPV
jgi:quercetin dioxygenase-like cupin family protein